MELFFREAALDVTMGGLEGRARDTGLAVTDTDKGISMMDVCLCMVDERINFWTVFVVIVVTALVKMKHMELDCLHMFLCLYP